SATFFFSSRRRHTRSKRDWSSDVCSSDLTASRRRPQPRSPRAMPPVISSTWVTASYRTPWRRTSPRLSPSSTLPRLDHSRHDHSRNDHEGFSHMRIAIIRAGLAGLTAAHEIHKADPDTHIDVLEAGERIGGKLFTVPFESGPTDMGAEAYLATRADATEFCHELGLGDSLVTPSGARSQLYAGGRLRSLPRGGV